jgi:hypothetical protein
LSQIERAIDRFIGDGMYDKDPVCAAVEQHSPGARVIIPPRKDAVLSPTGTSSPTQRDQHLLEIERAGRFKWKRTSGYYLQEELQAIRDFFCSLAGRQDDVRHLCAIKTPESLVALL